MSPDAVAEKAPDGTIDPRRAVQEINRVVPKDWFLVGGSGHCAYFTATNTQDRPPELYASIRHFGAIGSGLSHAIGVAVARNDRKILLIDGDGSLIMHIQELETIARHGMQMLIVALNDGAYGSEVHKLRMDGVSDKQVRFGRPDFARIAEGFSLRGARITDLAEIEPRFEKHLASGTRPKYGTFRFPAMCFRPRSSVRRGRSRQDSSDIIGLQLSNRAGDDPYVRGLRSVK